MLRKIFTALVLLSLIALLPSAVSAESEVSDPERLFPIVTGAPGVSVSGQLAIYYDVVPNVLGCLLDQVNMFFVFRLQMGTDGVPAGFAGSLGNVCYETSGPQITAVMGFVQNNVVPFFFPPKRPNSKLPPVQLAAVGQIVQDGRTQIAPPFFFLMNVEFRVDVKRAP